MRPRAWLRSHTVLLVVVQVRDARFERHPCLASVGIAQCDDVTLDRIESAFFALALPAVYMTFTAVASTCLGYRLMGKPSSSLHGALT